MADYTAVVWKGNSNADALHAMPRCTGGDTVPLDDADFTAYITGVSILPGCIVLLFVLWTIALCFPCCRRCGSTLSGTPLYTMRIFFGVLGFFLFGALIATYFGSDQLNKGFNDVLDGSRAMEQLFDSGLALATGSETTLAHAKGLSDGIVSGDGYGCPAVAQAQLSTEMSKVSTSIDGALSELSGFTKAVPETVDILSGLNENMGKGAEWRTTGTIIVLGALTLCCAVFILADVLGTCDVEVECLLWSLSYLFVPLTIFLLFLMVICCAVYTVLAFVAADTCVSPTENILAQIELHSSASNYNASIFYATCEGTSEYLVELDGSKAEVETARGALSDLSSDKATQDAINSCTGAVELNQNLEALSADLVSVSADIDTATGLVQCKSVNPIYVKVFFDGLCTGVTNGATALFASMLAVFLVAMLLLTIRNVYQPGDEAFNMDGAGSTGLGGATYSKTRNPPQSMELHRNYGDDFV